ncbi:hypothetical protein AB4156_26475 [Cupriavidus sp. 2MCAB6]|uniref:hypothetical protein n=1 Tax=Cupriavidus sp. 2MCAB6 TaxID=3232981 RepID=UPI003F92DB51
MGNQVGWRRFVVTAAFAGVGVASVVACSVIDAYLCDVFLRLCTPRPGACVGIDVCPADVRMLFGLILLIPVPPVLFGVLGFVLSTRVERTGLLAVALVATILTHWAVTFAATRIVAL